MNVMHVASELFYFDSKRAYGTRTSLILES